VAGEVAGTSGRRQVVNITVGRGDVSNLVIARISVTQSTMGNELVECFRFVSRHV
jgi:hypothetical protein